MGAVVVYRTERRVWEVRYYRDGGRQRKAFRGDDGEALAREFAAAIDDEARAVARWLADDGSPVRADEALRGWLATYRSTLSRSYEQTALGLIERHLIPHFGGRSLRTLNETDSLQFADRLLELGRSPSVIRNALSIMRRVAGIYAAKGLIPRNPFVGVGDLVSKIERREAREVHQIDAWTRAEVAQILATARDRKTWVYPVLVFLFHTGARRGEALGLRWADVDLARGVVRIRRARVHGVDVTPKSGRARDIPIDAAGPDLRAMLASMARKRPEREGIGSDPSLVFRSPAGRPIDERNLSRAWASLRRVLARQGVRPLRLHDARHTFASHALEAGVSPSRVAAWLGHASLETTLRVYAHVVPAEREVRGFLMGPEKAPQSSPRIV